MKPTELRLGKMIPPVVLPEGYCGKILLVSISVGEERLVVLRSGDLGTGRFSGTRRPRVGGLGLTERGWTNWAAPTSVLRRMDRSGSGAAATSSGPATGLRRGAREGRLPGL